MPYTPPSQQSPAPSKPTSPVTSRNPSYYQDDALSPLSTPSQPPRSHSSASYLHKHRRTPSINESEGAPPTPTNAPWSGTATADFESFGSNVRQSPPPVNNLRIPTGAVISPPDSSENSDGDDANVERGRELEKNWDQLQQAVWAIPQQREVSPGNKLGTRYSQPSPRPESHSQLATPPALSNEARKISHSRSATETKIVLKKPSFTESPTQTDESDEDDGPLSKPSLVRKKSGELVKPALRPSSRRCYSSMPGTPTYHKSVHFNDNDNQTRHFLQVDRPIAVSAGTSPVDTYDSETEFPFYENDKQPEFEIQVANFPENARERLTRPVRVERLFLSSDKTTLVGVVAVQNLAFNKLVVARFTLDYWKTTSEVVAEYNNDVRNRPTDGCDRFTFHIKLSDQANVANKTLLLCVRYSVNGQDYWDNNGNTNYQIDFMNGGAKKSKPTQSIQANIPTQRPLNLIPRSRHSAPTPRAGKKESADDDFVSRFGSGTGYSFGSPKNLIGDATTSIKLKPKPTRSSLYGSPAVPSNGLGSRYDFGSSLSAALSTAQDKVGRQNRPGAGAGAKATPKDAHFGPQDRTEPAKADVTTERPDAITTDRPAMGSEQYRDLVQKFCYYTSGPDRGSTSPPTAVPQSFFSRTTQPVPINDGAGDLDSNASSPLSSGTSTPAEQMERANDRALLSSIQPCAVRVGSPTPFSGQQLGARATSPVDFGYPFYSTHRDGYLSEHSTPTAIRG